MNRNSGRTKHVRLSAAAVLAISMMTAVFPVAHAAAAPQSALAKQAATAAATAQGSVSNIAPTQPAYSGINKSDVIWDPNSGKYYAFGGSTSNSQGQFNVGVISSTDLETWSPTMTEGLPASNLPTWADQCGGGHPWAPSVAHINSQWVMWYSAAVNGNCANNAPGEHCLSVATSANPQGPYKDNTTGPAICQSSGPDGNGGAIDPEIKQNGSSWNLIWKNDGNNIAPGGSVPDQIWAGALDSTGTVIQSSPTPFAVFSGDANATWQADGSGNHIVEGPDQVTAPSGIGYLLYAGGRSGASGNAGIGYATCSFLTCSNQSVSAPWFGSTGNISGPSAPDVFTDQAGKLRIAFTDANSNLYISCLSFNNNVPVMIPCPAYEGTSQPDVIWDPGTQKYYSFSGFTGHPCCLLVSVTTSTNLRTWSPVTAGLLNTPSWSSTCGGGFTWPPAVAHIGNQWVMWYSVSLNGYCPPPPPSGGPAPPPSPGVHCLSVATSPTPQGPYTDNSPGPQACDGTQPSAAGGSIDPEIMQNGSAWYLIWKNDGNTLGGSNNIWIQSLDSTGTVLTGSAPTNPMLKSDLDPTWQDGQPQPNIEGPDYYASSALGGYLFYTGGNYQNPYVPGAQGKPYAIGYAECLYGGCVNQSTANPWFGHNGTDPTSWMVGSDCLTDIVGPGAPDIFTDASGHLRIAFTDECPQAGGADYSGQGNLYIEYLSFSNGVPVISLTPPA